MRCNYRFCVNDIPEDNNANSRYCNINCYDSEKLARAKDNYARRKKSLLEIERNEVLLRVFHNKYGNAPFDINLVRAEKMNWVITTGSITLDGIEYRAVGSFGYAAFEGNLIRIVKL